MADQVYVLGVGMIRFGRYPDKKVEELGGEAVLLALDDAGMTIQDIQAVYSGNLLRANDTVGQRILGQIGQTGVPVVRSNTYVKACLLTCITALMVFPSTVMSPRTGPAGKS